MEHKGKQHSGGPPNDGFLNKCKKKVVDTYKEVSTRGKKKKGKKIKDEPEESTAMGGGKDRPVRKGNDFMRDLTTDQKNNYEKFTRSVLATGVKELLKEYNEQLKPYQAKEFKRDIFDKNAAKNRYRDIVCNDLTRVVLQTDGKEGDYIHANLVKVEGCKNEFICTQGPTPTTTTEFWRMILQNTVQHIIMLCEVVEQGKPKCEQYWPTKENEKMTFGDITVTNTKVETDKKGAVIKTYLLASKGSTSMELRHHLWKQWPDKLIPASSLAALRVLNTVRVSDRPIVVHCSAGIGRTGTMVAIEICLQKLITTGQLSLLQMCKKLRDCRMHSIQVELQYLYLAQTIMEYGKANSFWNDTELNTSLDKFKVQVDMLTKATPRVRPTPIPAGAGEKIPISSEKKSNEKVVEIVKKNEKFESKEVAKEKESKTDKDKEEKKKEADKPKESKEKKKDEKDKEREQDEDKEIPREKDNNKDRKDPKAAAEKSERKKKHKAAGPLIPVAPPHVVNASPPKVHVIRTHSPTPDHPALIETKAPKEKAEPNYLIPKVGEALAHTPHIIHVMTPAQSPATSPAVSSPAKTTEAPEMNAITAYGGVNETPVLMGDEVVPVTAPPAPPVTPLAAPAAAPAVPEPAPAPAKKDEKEFINSVFMM